jgi:hypothetical protein
MEEEEEEEEEYYISVGTNNVIYSTLTKPQHLD